VIRPGGESTEQQADLMRESAETDTAGGNACPKELLLKQPRLGEPFNPNFPGASREVESAKCPAQILLYNWKGLMYALSSRGQLQIKEKRSVRLVVLAVTLLAYIPRLDAGAVNFIFSFTNSTGNVPGTVTGEILGLLDNSTSPAAHIIINSYPGAFNPTPFSPPVDASAFPNQFLNSFTVTGGVITSAKFDADTAFLSTPPNQYILNFNTSIGQFFDTTNVPSCCATLMNVTGPISFQAVPEPGSAVLIFGGMSWLLRKFRKRIVV
jgi:hypothetical protein